MVLPIEKTREGKAAKLCACGAHTILLLVYFSV
jgi:hypothetical protein